VIWQIENRLFIDDGTAFTSPRNTFVGLAAAQLGTLRFGNYDTAYKLSTLASDVFADTLADYNAVMGADAAGSQSYPGGAIFDVRETNSVHYASPVINGFSAMLSYGQRNEAGNSAADPQLWSGALRYANGPLTLNVGYEAHDDFSGAGSFLSNRRTRVGGAGATMIGTSDDSAWRVGGSYVIGDTTVHAVYERLQSEGELSLPINPTSFEIDRDAYYLAATHQLGNWVFRGAYAHATDTDGGVANIDDGVTQWTLGADYNLSKRTLVYVFYTALDNDAQAAYSLGSSNTSGQFVSNGDGSDPAGFVFGLRHAF
jgi:predicted porin